MRFMHMGRADLRHRDCRQARGVDPGGPWSELNTRSSITHPAGAGHPHTHPLHFIPRGPGFKRTNFKEPTDPPGIGTNRAHVMSISAPCSRQARHTAREPGSQSVFKETNEHPNFLAPSLGGHLFFQANHPPACLAAGSPWP